MPVYVDTTKWFTNNKYNILFQNSYKILYLSIIF